MAAGILKYKNLKCKTFQKYKNMKYKSGIVLQQIRNIYFLKIVQSYVTRAYMEQNDQFMSTKLM